MKRKYEKLLNALSKGGKPDEKTLSDLEKTVSEFKKIFKV